MTIVNRNAKRYICYHYYCFLNVQRSELKWYSIAVQMEIIFCRCGGAEVIFDGSAPFIPNLFSTFFINSAAKIRFRTAEGGAACGSTHLWIIARVSVKVDVPLKMSSFHQIWPI